MSSPFDLYEEVVASDPLLQRAIDERVAIVTRPLPTRRLTISHDGGAFEPFEVEVLPGDTEESLTARVAEAIKARLRR